MNSTIHQEISSLYIETTELCNLNCKYCYNKPAYKDERDLSADSMFKVIDDLAKHDMHPNVMLSGGEFLMRKDSRKIIDHLTKNSPSVAIATNGVLLSDETIKFIKQYENVFIQVSLDGMTDQDNRYRGIKSERIISVLNKMIKADMYSRLSIRMTIHKANWRNIEKMLLFCKKNHIELRLSFMCFSNWRPESKEYLLETNEIYQVFCIVDKFNETYNCNFQLPDICVGGECGLMNEQGSLAIKIDVKGDIYACQAGQSSNFLLGNLSQTSVYDCTKPANLKIIRNKIILRKHLLQEKCATCSLKEDCIGRCVAHIENEEGSFYTCSERYRFAFERYIQCGNAQ